MKRTILILSIALAAALSCSRTSVGIYDDPSNWYDNGRKTDPALADVFYILPTCVFDWTDSLGTVHHHASLSDEAQRAAMEPSYRLADRIFADSANFFAPYYRHISLDVWEAGDAAVAEHFPLAMDDIRAAFTHYLEHENSGRPFVLAGFSQGGKCVVELLKDMDRRTFSRMAAAYVCGYRVTQEDIAAADGRLVPASSATDTGVTVCYNTVSDPAAAVPTLSGGNLFAINPASWTTDTLPHALNDSVSVRIDPGLNVLVTDGIDPARAFVPSLANLFPVGNLHLLELTLYEKQLQANVKERLKKKPCSSD